MRKAMFIIFSVVYVLTAITTLISFLVQARIIPSQLGSNESIPYLGLLVSAVLVETVAGYLALGKYLFSPRQSSDEVKNLALTTMILLNRLQALAFQFSSTLSEKIEELNNLPIVGGLLQQHGLSGISERTKFIISITKELEAAIRKAEEALESNDAEKLRVINRKLLVFSETIESWVV